MRSYTALAHLKNSFRLSNYKAQKTDRRIAITDNIDNLPITWNQQNNNDLVDYFQEKWTEEREKVIKFPENLKETEVQRLIYNMIKLPNGEFKELTSSDIYHDFFLKKLSNRLSSYEEQTLVDVTNFLVKAIRPDSSKELQMLDQIQDILTHKQRAEFLTIEQVADLLWNFAYANRGNRTFFRQLETVIIDYDMDGGFDYRLLGKILWGLSHNDKGTTPVYSKIAKMIKKIHTEISPLKMAEYSFYFSKATESMQGGFGVYQLAEKSISDNIRYFTFQELVRTTEYLFPQKIGTNEFHSVLEKRILELYPSEIAPSALVSLCKSTAYHKFQNEKLVRQLDKDVSKYFEHFSNSQLELVIWSYIRNKRVNEDFFAKVEIELMKRLKLMTHRGIVFTFYDLSLAGRSNPQLLQAYHDYFHAYIDKLNTHYLTKVLIALSYKPYDEFTSKMFSILSQRINQLADKFRKNEVVKILEAVHNYPAVSLPENAEEIFRTLRLLVLDNAHKFTIIEVCKILFYYSESGKLDQELEEVLLSRVTDVKLIPKSVFAETFYSLILIGKHKIAVEFLPIVNELGSYGNIKYFFDHSSYIRLIWSLAALTLRNVDQDIMQNISSTSIQEALLDINPNTLRPKVLILYLQLLQAIGIFGKLSIEQELQLSTLLREINEGLLDELFKSYYVSKNSFEAKESIAKMISEKILENPQKFKIYIDAKDEFYNMVDIAVTDEENRRFALLLLNEGYFVRENLLNEVSRIKIQTMEQIMNWKVFTIDINVWQSMTDLAQKEFLTDTIKNTFPST